MDGKERGDRTEGGRSGGRMPEKEKRKKEDPLSRIESELDLRLLGIKTFETSTGQQDRLQLNHSSSRTLFHSSFLGPTCISFLPRLCFPIAPTSTSLSTALSLLSVFTWTHRTRTLPSPPPSLSIFDEKSLRLLPFAPPLSRPDLGASRLHVACPNDVSERTGTTAI